MLFLLLIRNGCLKFVFGFFSGFSVRVWKNVFLDKKPFFFEPTLCICFWIFLFQLHLIINLTQICNSCTMWNIIDGCLLNLSLMQIKSYIILMFWCLISMNWDTRNWWLWKWSKLNEKLDLLVASQLKLLETQLVKLFLEVFFEKIWKKSLNTNFI